MKQRKLKLTMLCITAALLSTAHGMPVAASEVKAEKEILTQENGEELSQEPEKAKLHAGISSVTTWAAEIYQEEIEKEEPPQEENVQELAVAQVDSYINVRNQPSVEGEIIGKLYDDSVGEIIGEEADGEWLLIKSGNVEGYIKSEYALRGEEGQAKAEEVGRRFAKVTAVTLRVREEATTESDTMTLLPVEEVLPVHEEVEGWAKVSTEEGEGYISTDFAEVYTEHKVAESKEEEEERLRREEEERQAAIRAEEQRAAANRSKASSGSKSSSAPKAPANSDKNSGNQGSQNSSLGSSIANFALQFVGNPYVYGGTSLTNGADCSGFVQSVFKNFGISLPRTSGEQGQCGTNVGGIGNARPGDLVSYSGHIGIYIGNGQIVHASSVKTGIKVSNANYRPILSVRRIV
ncbi:MAG: C40 family peptidase [Lachnospiraceae bacterium]|nr:C40 family peptidase [Lachnospiraceae bacterium]